MTLSIEPRRAPSLDTPATQRALAFTAGAVVVGVIPASVLGFSLAINASNRAALALASLFLLLGLGLGLGLATVRISLHTTDQVLERSSEPKKVRTLASKGIVASGTTDTSERVDEIIYGRQLVDSEKAEEAIRLAGGDNFCQTVELALDLLIRRERGRRDVEAYERIPQERGLARIRLNVPDWVEDDIDWEELYRDVL